MQTAFRRDFFPTALMQRYERLYGADIRQVLTYLFDILGTRGAVSDALGVSRETLNSWLRATGVELKERPPEVRFPGFTPQRNWTPDHPDLVVVRWQYPDERVTAADVMAAIGDSGAGRAAAAVLTSHENGEEKETVT